MDIILSNKLFNASVSVDSRFADNEMVMNSLYEVKTILFDLMVQTDLVNNHKVIDEEVEFE